MNVWWTNARAQRYTVIIRTKLRPFCTSFGDKLNCTSRRLFSKNVAGCWLLALFWGYWGYIPRAIPNRLFGSRRPRTLTTCRWEKERVSACVQTYTCVCVLYDPSADCEWKCVCVCTDAGARDKHICVVLHGGALCLAAVRLAYEWMVDGFFQLLPENICLQRSCGCCWMHVYWYRIWLK